MARISKRKKVMSALFDRDKKFPIEEAIKIIQDYKTKCSAKFVESFDIAIHTGINTQKNETVKGVVALPHGIGKQVKIAVFAEDASVLKELKGAEVVSLEQLKSGYTGFDTLITVKSSMPNLKSVAKILGPKGLMPNEKLGTVASEAADLQKIIDELLKGRVEFRSDKQANINLRIGRIDFSEEQLKENILTLLNAVRVAKPATTKANYILSITLSSTMGVGVKLSLEGIN